MDNVYEGNRPRKKKKPKFLRIFVILISILCIIISFIMFTKPGRKIIIDLAGDYIYGKFEHTEATPETKDKEVINITKEEKKESSHIVNILLIGVEEFENAKNTDSMIIATMNTKDHSLKLTSLMRDLYVQIPGYKDNRLNSAYSKGGIELLYDTIELNFGIQMDGYVLVNFDAFQKIVDMVGGIDITLTEGEAEYLRTKNYISDPKNRNVVAGTQHMNGNQVLGYCRVRKVSTGTEHDDFGRTQRQRIVLQAIYDKIRDKNLFQQIFLMNDILNDIPIVTDIQREAFKDYLNEATTLKVKNIDMNRIPADGEYENAKVQIGSRMQEVLQPKDWEATRKELHTFIYGD